MMNRLYQARRFCCLAMLAAAVFAAAGCVPARQIDAGISASGGLGQASQTSSALRLPLPYAQVMVTINDGVPGRMLLAQYQHDTAHWLADNGLSIWTRAGRIVATRGLRDDLLGLYWLSAPSDPIALAQSGKGSVRGRLFADLDIDGEGRVALSQMETDGVRRPVRVSGRTMLLVRVQEHVRIPDLGRTWENEYWVAPKEGAVLVTRQQIPLRPYSVRMERLLPETR